MHTYDNDMMPTEIKVRDLAPGDMVDGTEILNWLSEHAGLVDDTYRIAAEYELWTVAEIVMEYVNDDTIVVLHTEGSGSWALPPDLEVTCHGALCCECGDHVLDCECEV